MELGIRPHPKNSFPIGGILIRNASATHWIHELQKMQMTAAECRLFAIPGIVPNSIWGCLVIPFGPINKTQTRQNQLCQQVTPNVFIAERSILHPTLTNAEIERLFSASIHVIHPEFGFAELTEEIDLQKLIEQPVKQNIIITCPQSAVYIPTQVKSFMVQPVSPEEIMKNMEEKIFPKKEKMLDKPLNIFEKGKLAMYRLLFTNTKSNGEKTSPVTEKTGLLSKLESLFSSLIKKDNRWVDKLQEDFEDLEKRNQKEIDKLLNMLKDNPEEALKYALPLDDQGSARGSNNGRLDLTRKWFNFSLFGNNIGSGSGSIDLGDHYFELQKQYHETAKALIERKDYHKAAFVYLKLLKNHHLAAETLEAGKHYQEAATIYLKYDNNKRKAAQCYEKGNMTKEAIELYKELNENEKVGDLYASIYKRKEADIYYQKVVDSYTSTNQFIKASLIYKNKMHNDVEGQTILLEGWRKNKDAVNCLSFYFSYLHDEVVLGKEIQDVYAREVDDTNRAAFLQVIKNEFKKQNELAPSIKEMAYEIIAAEVPSNPSIVGELKAFNPSDKELVKDTIRFTTVNSNKNWVLYGKNK